MFAVFHVQKTKKQNKKKTKKNQYLKQLYNELSNQWISLEVKKKKKIRIKKKN